MGKAGGDGYGGGEREESSARAALPCYSSTKKIAAM